MIDHQNNDTILDIYKKNNINDYDKLISINLLNNYINIVILTYNNLNNIKYMFLKKELYNIYINLKKIIVNNIGINYF